MSLTAEHQFLIFSFGGREFVEFRVPYQINRYFIERLSTKLEKAEAHEIEVRHQACNGLKLAQKNKQIVSDIWGKFESKEWKESKSVKFSLTSECEKLIKDFRTEYSFIKSDKQALQILFSIPTIEV